MMEEIQSSDIFGDWLLTGGATRIALRLESTGRYSLDQLAPESTQADRVVASHTGTWMTVPSRKVGEHLPELWLAMTIESSENQPAGHQFGWPRDPDTPELAMLLVEKHSSHVFNVLDSFDDRVFNAIMLPRSQSVPEAQVQAAFPVQSQPATANPAPPPPPPRSQEEVLAGLRAEVERLQASLSGSEEPSLLQQVEKLRQQVKDKQDALETQRVTDQLSAEKKRLDQQRDLLNAQMDAEASRAKMRQAEAAKEAQIRQIQAQIAVDDAKAAGVIRAIQAAGDDYVFTTSQEINSRHLAARDKAHDLFMRSVFRG